MSYKVLITADWHLSNRLPHSIVQKLGVSDRFKQQLDVCKKIFAIAIEHNVERIFILGDLFDRSLVDPVTLIYATRILVKNNEIPISILPGNHDTNNNKGGRFLVEAFSEMRAKHISVIGSGSAPVLEGHSLNNKKDICFWPIQYVQLNELIATIKTIKKAIDKDKFNVLLLHASISGSTIGNWHCTDGLDPSLLKGFSSVYAGHFHDTQGFSDTGMYVGAPMQHDFSDAGRKRGCWIVDIGKSEKFVPINSPEFHIIEYCDGCVSDKEFRKGSYIRIEVSATHSDWKIIKPRVDKLVLSLRANELNASCVHKPIYHHEHRLPSKTGGDGAPMDLHLAIMKYVDMVGSGQELDPGKLKQMGADVIKRAKEKA